MDVFGVQHAGLCTGFDPITYYLIAKSDVKNTFLASICYGFCTGFEPNTYNLTAKNGVKNGCFWRPGRPACWFEHRFNPITYNLSAKSGVRYAPIRSAAEI